MSESNQLAWWRDEPVRPADYEDMAQLVYAARKARDRLVEFDWTFRRDELEQLRRAVFEWGRNNTGRYKAFDARVLAAINAALGELDTAFVLKEPKKSWLRAEVRCEPADEEFHLRGQATFDLVFGYGLPGTDDSAAGAAHLPASVRRTLAHSVEVLGWDPGRLVPRRYRAVRNVLFGMAPGEADPDEPPHEGPVSDVSVHFNGPFSAHPTADCRCLFSEPMGAKSGVYLWTLTLGGIERPWYVGQTRVGFRTRMAQHLGSILSGEYTPYDMDALKRGEYRLAGPTADGWPTRLASVLEHYERLVPHLLEQIRLTRYHLAELPNDAHLINRVEGAVGRYFKTHKATRGLFTPGLKVPAAIPYDKPIRLVISSDSHIPSLPTELLV